MTQQLYTVEDYSEETYCDYCGRLLSVGDKVYPDSDGQHVFCSPNCKPVESTCGFQAFGIMPPCVLKPRHLEDHADGFGGFYSIIPEGVELVQVEGSKELRYVSAACLESAHNDCAPSQHGACGCVCHIPTRACAACSKPTLETALAELPDQRLVCSICDNRIARKLVRQAQPSLFGQQSLI